MKRNHRPTIPIHAIIIRNLECGADKKDILDFRKTRMFFTAEKFRHIFSKNLVRKFRQIIQSKFDEILRKSKFKILKWANIILTFKGAKKPLFLK